MRSNWSSVRPNAGVPQGMRVPETWLRPASPRAERQHRWRARSRSDIPPSDFGRGERFACGLLLKKITRALDCAVEVNEYRLGTHLCVVRALRPQRFLQPPLAQLPVREHLSHRRLKALWHLFARAVGPMAVSNQPHPNPHVGAHLLIPPGQAQTLEIAVISMSSRGFTN
jgi:hypothetical protein